MKNQWLNIVLSFTNRIYKRKQLIVGQTGLGAIYNILILILSEIMLGIVSLPLYLSVQSSGVTAFFAEKGTYAKVAFDYNLRRVLTLTGVGIFAAIWAVKLILILSVPAAYGPLKLYSVSDFRPADILSKDLIATETGIQTARIVPSVPRPTLGGVKKSLNGDHTFFGTGQPRSTLVLLLSDQQTVIYTTDIAKDGTWEISHSQKSFRLNEGNHSVIVFSYDSKLGVRSEAAPEQFFKVTTTWWDLLVKNVDVLANGSVILLILLGVFLTFLTL